MKKAYLTKQAGRKLNKQVDNNRQEATKDCKSDTFRIVLNRLGIGIVEGPTKGVERGFVQVPAKMWQKRPCILRVLIKNLQSK